MMISEKEYGEHLGIRVYTYDELVRYNWHVAKANQKYHIGDIIQDHYHIIKITEVTYNNWCSPGETLPHCSYFGVVLTKKLKRKANQGSNCMYETRIKAKLN